MRAGFSTETRGGFHINFNNGASVSVQIGPGTYSDNYNASFDCFFEGGKLPDRKSAVAETAIMVKGKCVSQMYDPESWGVLGHQTVEQVLAMLNWVAALSADDVTTLATLAEDAQKARMTAIASETTEDEEAESE